MRQTKNIYPIEIYWDDSFGDLYPDNPKSLYTWTSIEPEDEDDMDEDYKVQITIPTRLALYQLIRDLSKRVIGQIDAYGLVNKAPADDASYNLYEVINLIYELKIYDETYD